MRFGFVVSNARHNCAYLFFVERQQNQVSYFLYKTIMCHMKN
jgi:hypothetical protein